MKKIILTFLLLTSIVSFSQEETKERFLFERKLNLATKNDSISKHIKIIKEISIPANIDSLSSDSKWELLYLHQTGWQESMPNNPHKINNLYIGKRNNIVTGKDLKNFFQTCFDQASRSPTYLLWKKVMFAKNVFLPSLLLSVCIQADNNFLDKGTVF